MFTTLCLVWFGLFVSSVSIEEVNIILWKFVFVVQNMVKKAGKKLKNGMTKK